MPTNVTSGMGILRIDIDTRDLQQAIRQLQKADTGWTHYAREEARDLGRTVTWVMRNELEPVRYTGALERSVSTYIEASRSEVKLTVGPTVPHALYIRYGTRPHWAPIAPLKRWAMWKLGDAKAGYAVQRSIAAHGTSRWAEKLYGTKANPFDERTMRRPETKLAVKRYEDAVWRRFVYVITGGTQEW